MAGQPKKRAREAAAAAAARVGETDPPPVRASAVAQTIAVTLPAPPLFPPAASFPGVSGVRVRKGPPAITAFDPVPVVAAVPIPVQTDPVPARPPASTEEPGVEFADAVEAISPPAPPAPLPPPRRPPPPPPRTREAPPPLVDAAQGNAYDERMTARQQEWWAKSRDVPIPEVTLMHAWCWALQQYPARALTIWLTRVEPAQNAYHIYIAGDEVAGDYYPDRKLYEVVRSKRRQPAIAEKFVGRIRGKSAEGRDLDITYGEISLPPEDKTAPPSWGYGAGAPPAWGSYGPPGYPGGPPPGYYPPPGYGYPGYGPAGWGGPPPSWATPYWGPAPAPSAPPANIAANPELLEVWKIAQEANLQIAKLASERDRITATGHNDLLSKLLERVLTPAAAAAPPGGLKETLSALSEAVGLLDKLRGKSDAGDARGAGIHIHRVDDDLIVENKDGEIDPVATIGLGMKSGVKEIVKAIGQARAANKAQGGPAGAVGAGPGLSGASVRKGPPLPPAAPPNNGAAS